MKTSLSGLYLLLCGIQYFMQGIAKAVTLFPHGSASELDVINDFLYTEALSTPIFFHGSSKSSVYVSGEGFVTFDGGFSSGDSFPLTTNWISPFGANMLEYNGKFKKQEISTTDVLTKASDLVNEIYKTDNFAATSVLVVTWVDVKKFSPTPDARANTFQLALATDGAAKSYALYLYEKIEWYPAQIGVSAGDSSSFYRICDTDKYMATFLPIKSSNQCAAPGVIVFRLDQSVWPQSEFPCSLLHTAIRCSTNPGIPEANRNIRCSAGGR